MEKPITIHANNVQLAAILHYPTLNVKNDEHSRYPVIAICHGFAGNRIGTERLFVKAARAFAEQGYYVLRFDYGGCGESTGDYGASTVEVLVEQTRYALNYLLDLEGIDRSRVILLGHSLGGVVALLTAIKDRRVSKLILWSAVGYPFEDIVQVTGKEVYEQALVHGSGEFAGVEFQQAFFTSLAAIHPFQEAKAFKGDVLLVQGTADDVIDVKTSELYQKLFWARSDGQCDRELILQANHAYETGAHAKQAIEKSLAWLTQLQESKDAWYGWSI